MDVFIPLNRFTFTWDPNRIAYNYNRDISLTKWKKNTEITSERESERGKLNLTIKNMLQLSTTSFLAKSLTRRAMCDDEKNFLLKYYIHTINKLTFMNTENERNWN